MCNEELLNAVQNNDIEGVKMSLNNGADSNFKDSRSWSALMIAAGNGNNDCTSSNEVGLN